MVLDLPKLKNVQDVVREVEYSKICRELGTTRKADGTPLKSIKLSYLQFECLFNNHRVWSSVGRANDFFGIPCVFPWDFVPRHSPRHF